MLLLLLLVSSGLLSLARGSWRCRPNSVIHLILVVVDTFIAVLVLAQPKEGLTMAGESSQLVLNLSNEVSVTVLLSCLPPVTVIQEVLVLFEVVITALLLLLVILLGRVSFKVCSLLLLQILSLPILE